MTKPPIRLLALLSLASLLQIFLHAEEKPDFRKVAWGMTQAAVMATEPRDRPVEVAQSNGKTTVKYDPAKAAELNGRLIYIFAGDKLVRQNTYPMPHTTSPTISLPTSEP